METIEVPIISEFALLELEEGLSRQSRLIALAQKTPAMEHTTAGISDLLVDPDSHPATPRLEWPTSISSFPPENFGIVAPGIYRSSYPQPHDFPYLQRLQLKTIITLVQKDMSDDFRAFVHGNGINHQIFDMTGTKKADIPLHMMQSIMSLLVDETNHPVLIHCKQGKHRTGCAVGVLRKYHGWDTRSVLAEYQSYAQPKVRETDMNYLNGFELATLSNVAPQRKQVAKASSPVGGYLCLFIAGCLFYFLWLMMMYKSESSASQVPPPGRGTAWRHSR